MNTSISKLNKQALYTHVKLLKEQLSTSEWFNNTLEEEIKELKKEVVNIVNIKNKQIEKEKYKYESMCSEQADSDCAKYIKELKEEIENIKGGDDVCCYNCKDLTKMYEKLKDKNDELKKKFNMLIDLIKTADTDMKINLLKELDKLD